MIAVVRRSSCLGIMQVFEVTSLAKLHGRSSKPSATSSATQARQQHCDAGCHRELPTHVTAVRGR